MRTDLFARHKSKHAENEAGHAENNDGKMAEDRREGQTTTSSSDLEAYQYQSNHQTATSISQSLPPGDDVRANSHGQASVAPMPPPSSHYASSLRPSYSMPNHSLPNHQADNVRDSGTIDSTLMPSQSIGTPWLPLGPGDGIESTDNFASWLFESPKSQNYDFDLTNLPYIDFGVDFSPSTANDTALRSSVADLGIPAAADSWTPTTLDWTPDAHSSIPEARRQEVIQLVQIFIRKSKRSKQQDYTLEGIIYHSETGELPHLTAHVLENITQAFWASASVQVAVIHQWTFSCSNCHPLLLMAIIALGASALVHNKPKGSLQDYRTLADLITTHLRWEIFTDDDSQPPVQLWVAQALLLIELHEKMYSTRRLHERAVIHHASTMTLLRRGSPLIGRAGSESPQRDTTACPSPNGGNTNTRPHGVNGYSWWRRWAKNESMHRVVFTAFQMDVLHAVMFGHEHQ